MPRTLIESKQYSAMLAELGPVERLDEVLRSVCWSLHVNAEGWPVVTGFQRVRLAKTDGYASTVRLRVWYRILSDDEVELLAIEPDPALTNGHDAEE